MYRRFICIILSSIFIDHNANAQSATTGMWQSNSYTDQLTNKTVVQIAIDPTSDTDNEFQQTGIYIICAPNNELQLSVNWDQKLTTDVSQSTFEIDYRIGNNDVQSEQWDLSTDNFGQFYHGNVLAFIQQLETSNVFVAQATPVGGNPITATYDTTGLSNAVLPVLKACGFNQS